MPRGKKEENVEICKHPNIFEEEFIKNFTHNIDGTLVIRTPHTVRFKCIDCDAPLDIFVAGGAFNF